MFLDNYNIRKLLMVATLFCVVFLQHCAEPENEDKADTPSYTNTLSSQSIGNGSSGQVEDYFYNFDDAISAEFFSYSGTRFNTSYDDFVSSYPYPPDSLTLKNFPDYLLDVSPDSSQFVVRHPIDMLVVGEDTITSDIGRVVQDSLQLFSSQFKNLESIEWDLDAEPSLQRYRLRNSAWVQKDTMIYYADTFDVKAYWAVLDTPLIDDGFMFVDTSEWNDTSYAFIKDDLMTFTNNFEFIRTQMHSDSLIFRINTDCNDNNQWDQKEEGVSDYNGDGDMKDILFESNDNFDYNGNGIIEDVVYEFIDRGNGLLDPAETYYDINGSGGFDLNEPYEDRNCNDRWDAAEVEDVGNGRYDDVEIFTLKDLDGDGNEEKYLYTIGAVPNNILVDWSNADDPQLLLDISIGDDLTDRWGNVYTDIIETVSFVDTKRKEIGDIDSLVTLYTHDVVGYIDNDTQSPGDYYVTKTEFISNRYADCLNLGTRANYDYQIFSQKEHVNQLVYKNYFLPPGFSDDFWYKNYLENEIFLYTYNGLIRDGEHLDTAYYDTTNIAVYFIEKSFDIVRSDEVTVPAARVNPYFDNGECRRPNSVPNNIGCCPNVDTTFTDAFKITHVTNMTMIGSGVEYGQKVYTWLARDHGIVKSDVYYRWSENPFVESFGDGEIDEFGRMWNGYSRIELAQLDVKKSGNVFRQLTNPAQIIDKNDFGNLPDFDFDPFMISNQAGFHTIQFGETQE